MKWMFLILLGIMFPATMKLNFTGVDTFGALPKGVVYGAEVVVSEFTKSKAGNPAWHRVFKIINAPEGSGPVHRSDGVLIAEDVEYIKSSGRQIFDDQGLTDKSRWAVMADLQAFGEDVSPDTKDFDFDPTEYIGREIGLVVENNVYQGNVRAQLGKLVQAQYIGFAVDAPEMSEAAAVPA